MIIKPYNQIQKGNDPLTIAAEFPACKLFVPMDDGVAGGQTPRELVSNSVLDLSSSSTDGDWTTNTNAFTLLSGFSVSAAALPQAITVGANNAILAFIGQATTIAEVNLLDSSSATLLKMDIDSGVATIQTAEGVSTPTIAASTATVGHGVQFFPGITNEGRVYQAAEDAVVTPVLEAGTADLTTMESIEKLTMNSLVSTGILYSMQIWVFTSYVPTDAEIGTMLAWTLNAHINGDKYLYPGWLGKT